MGSSAFLRFPRDFICVQHGYKPDKNGYSFYRVGFINPKHEFDKNVTYDFLFRLASCPSSSQVWTDMRIDVLNNMFDKSDYAFVELSNLTYGGELKLRSYSDSASAFVCSAFANTGITLSVVRGIALTVYGYCRGANGMKRATPKFDKFFQQRLEGK